MMIAAALPVAAPVVAAPAGGSAAPPADWLAVFAAMQVVPAVAAGPALPGEAGSVAPDADLTDETTAPPVPTGPPLLAIAPPMPRGLELPTAEAAPEGDGEAAGSEAAEASAELPADGVACGVEVASAPPVLLLATLLFPTISVADRPPAEPVALPPDDLRSAPALSFPVAPAERARSSALPRANAAAVVAAPLVPLDTGKEVSPPVVGAPIIDDLGRAPANDALAPVTASALQASSVSLLPAAKVDDAPPTALAPPPTAPAALLVPPPVPPAPRPDPPRRGVPAGDEPVLLAAPDRRAVRPVSESDPRIAPLPTFAAPAAAPPVLAPAPAVAPADARQPVVDPPPAPPISMTTDTIIVATDRLGAVRVAIDAADGLAVALSVDRGASAALLSAAVDRLDTALAASGQRLEALSVDVRGETGGRRPPPPPVLTPPEQGAETPTPAARPRRDRYA
ncbi:hypothetical protein [Glacieibacterium frigidum]|uniref:Flagellar hook-length control protein-like C-terminal domain-containing protein n=1 Tax=Glacieibacterium frigidum TaxID=2593303 RepID=A0A552U799_9SPHN|nr:hypothetical protein [Glacieibacterium frigidum]TRW14094.1 hypothetical protein FMM06_10200 [Glacieibacterium frigidum]